MTYLFQQLQAIDRLNAMKWKGAFHFIALQVTDQMPRYKLFVL